MTDTSFPIKNEAYTFTTGLVSRSDPLVYQNEPTIEAGDIRISIDGEALSNVTNLPTVSGSLVTISLTADEMGGDRIVIVFSDQAGDEWADWIIELQPLEEGLSTLTEDDIRDVFTYGLAVTDVAVYGISPTGLSSLVENIDYNLLDLDTWRAEINFHPWHFFQWSNTDVPVTSSTNDLIRQHAWQDYDCLSREDVKRAIINAETRLFEHLNYWPMPKYREAIMSWPQYPKANLLRTGYADPSGRWIGVRLPESHIQSLGIEVVQELALETPVVYSDRDGDGINDTFTVTISSSTTLKNDIAVYFSEEDRFTGEDPNEKWRIRPVRVSVDTDTETTTVTGPAWIMAKPILYEGIGAQALDPSDTDNYVSVVDVYRRYTYTEGRSTTTAQAVLIWENSPYPNWCRTTVDPSALGYAIARAVIRDSENGIVGISEAIYSTETGTWHSANFESSRPPDKVIVRYLAGYAPDYQNNMQSKMRYMVSRLAAAELLRRTGSRSEAHRQLYYWQEDLARSSGSDTYGYISREDLNNPFGTRRGQIAAWKEMKMNRNLRGFSAG